MWCKSLNSANQPLLPKWAFLSFEVRHTYIHTSSYRRHPSYLPTYLGPRLTIASLPPTFPPSLYIHTYIAVGGLLLLHWCWGILENTCNYLRINFVYLLDLSPKHVSSPRAIFDEAVNESIVYLTCMLLYYKVSMHSM